MEPSDEALVLACRRGDPAAWEALISRYRRLIYTIPRRAGLDDEHTADVFQHVWVTLLEHLDAIEQPARIGAWLVTTARRETGRLQRREHAIHVLGGSDAAGEADDPLDAAALPDEVVLRLEAQHTVRTAVARLDEHCRRMVMMLFYRPDPPPYAEIAAALGTNEGSIGPTRARCLQKLRRLLAQAGW